MGLKKVIVHSAIFLLLLSSCTEEIETVEPLSLTETQLETIEYFKEIALGFEFGGASEVTRRWKTDMKIYVSGVKKPALMNELYTVIYEVNELAESGFELSVVEDSLQSNYYLYLGSGKEYGILFPSSQSQINSNLGLFNINWDSQNNLIKGRMYVDIYKTDEYAQRHLLREELTQSLGLGKDSYKYPESIFQQNWTLSTEFTEIDKELIRLLYHSSIHSGMMDVEVEEAITKIYLTENSASI
jgi:hypothetical protein